MTVELIEAAYADVVFIARRLRALDAEEIFPLLFNPTSEGLAASAVYNNVLKTVALKNGVPVCAFGAGEHYPRFYKVWMFSTDRWPEVALSVTRAIKNTTIPALVNMGAVRADCWSMEGHDVAHRWLNILGAVREASAEDYGQQRKTYYCYSWTRSRLEKENVCRPICTAEDATTTATAAYA